MPYNLLLLPLIGGYLFVSRTYFFAFAAAKQSGERLLLSAALAAVLLLLSARLIVSPIAVYLPEIASIWREIMPWDYSGTAFLAFVLGIVVPPIFNWRYSLAMASQHAVRRYGNALDQLFFDAMQMDEQLIFTLDGGKVYAGWLDWTPPDPGSTDAYVRLLPTISGYRDESHVVQWTTFYQDAYAALPTMGGPALDSFIKVIPINQIITAGLFDPEWYYRFTHDHENLEADRGDKSVEPDVAPVE